MYEANLSIYCVDGTIYGCISSEVSILRAFLKQYDHEGSSISIVVRDDPDQMPFREIDDPEQVYKELEEVL
jgi:hypothetical protein